MGYFRKFKGVPIWEKDPLGKSAPRKIFVILIWFVGGGGVGGGNWGGVEIVSTLVLKSMLGWDCKYPCLKSMRPFASQKCPFIFENCPFVSWNCPFVVKKWLFNSQKCSIVFQNCPLVFQKCLPFVYCLCLFPRTPFFQLIVFPSCPA